MVRGTMTVDQVLDMREHLPATGQLRLIGLLSDRLRRELAPDDEPLDILSTVGLGAEMWQSVDVAAYLEEERARWER